MKKVQQENESSQEFAEQTKTLSISDNIEIYDIPNTPFGIVSENGTNFVNIANYRVSDNIETKEKALAWTKEITWNKIINVITIVQAINLINKQHEN